MISVPGYNNLQITEQRSKYLLYSATRSRDGLKVQLRQLRPGSNSPDEVEWFRQEFELLGLLDSEYVLSPVDLIEHNGSPILIYKQSEGLPVVELINHAQLDANQIDFKRVVSIATSTAMALDCIHAKGISHNNINPSSILFDSVDSTIKLRNFGYALPRLEFPAGLNLEGSLPYLAPEQTNRMNRSVDYRADFYGLGATLYHLSTGHPPFEGNDPLELVHSHIARQPVRPHELNPTVPKALSRITMKLLSKTPEDRYQSAFSIVKDLNRVAELQAGGDQQAKALDFTVALDDVAEQLNVSEKLIEREDALTQLESSLTFCAGGGVETVVCIGEAGVGKSSLISELEKHVVAAGGIVATGSCNPASIGIPYAGLSIALTDLIKQLLIRPDYSSIRDRIRVNLVDCEALLVSLVPILDRLIVTEHKQVDLTPRETKRRLVNGVAGLVAAAHQSQGPLVLCLDNIQWIDSASIEILDGVFRENRFTNVLMLGAYRTQELERDHETRVSVTRIIESNPNIKLIRLENLSRAGVAALISETFFQPAEEVYPLAQIVYSKSSGNPLAVKEFLTALHRRELLSFDRQHREWRWDLAAIANEPPSDNVSLLLGDRIQHLDTRLVHLLQIASCMGFEFDLDPLQAATDNSYFELAQIAAEAVSLGYLLHVHDDRQDSKRARYRFAHERIQQAAYGLLPAAKRRLIHEKLGLALLETDPLAYNVFEVVNQLNSSFESPEHTGIDRNRLAELNLSAGKRARDAAAFQASFKYFRTAIALYGQHIWQQYDLGLNLHLQATESAYLCGDSLQLSLLVEAVEIHARTPLDKARAYEIKIRSLITSDDLESAVALGHKVLEDLGIRISKRIDFSSIVLLTKLLLQTSRVKKQTLHPDLTMADKPSLIAMRLLMDLCQAGYLSGSPATPLYILKMTELSLRHGMAPESSFAYPMFGSLLVTYLGTIDFANNLGKLALAKLDESNPGIHCRATTLVNIFIFPWKHHLKTTLQPLADAQRLGMETGDIEFALIAGVTACANAFVLGQELNSLANKLSYNNKLAAEFNQTPMLRMGSIYHQAVLNLTTPSRTPWLIEGSVYSERSLLQRQHSRGEETSLANLYTLKLFIAMLFGRHDLALEFASEARRTLISIASSPAIGFFTIYESLACIRSLNKVSYQRGLILRLRLRRNLRLLRKWSHHAPDNILHGYFLVKAERARHHGNKTLARDFYERAIQAADNAKFLKEQAFCNELAGRFHLENGQRDLALFYLQRANTHYQRWGATTKVGWIRDEFAELGQLEPAQRPFSMANDFLAERFNSSGNILDLGTVIKASQVIAGEIVLENLLQRLMQVSLENAGADSASLILNRDNEFIVEINSWYQGQELRHKQVDTNLEDASNLPISVIQYAARTHEDVVLNDALHDDIFTQDEYIIQQRPKSILCVPIQSKSQLVGVLYLENMHTTHAFSQDRVAILKLLASQSAIAIENARLYEELNESRDRYLSLYQNAIQGIYEVNQQGQIETINPAGAQLLGYNSPEEYLAARKPDISDAFTDPEVFEEIQREVLKNGRIVGYETQILRKDNSNVWVSLSATLVYDERTREYHLEGSVVDITERRLREDAEQAKRVAEAATETKSQFLATMSHEIRTPMNAIVGFTDLALETPLSAAQREYLETIKSSSSHLLRVINDILDISKIESGRLELQNSPFRLSDLFTDVENLFRLEALERQIHLSLPRGDTLTRYLGDSVRIGQILINLVSNAFRATNRGSVAVEVEVQHRNPNLEALNFVVRDTGIGIDASHLDGIFESFNQGPGAHNSGGTGLGLAICQRLVNMMGGTIEVSSTPGEGSEFRFSVMVTVISGSDFAPATQAQIPAADFPVAGSHHLLVVEDNPVSRKLAREVLCKAGYRVTTANNGQEALQKLEESVYLAVLMDIRMPIMDGIQAIARIREDERHKHLPVIALSASVLDTEINRALHAGFDHYLSKPVNFDGLKTLLASLSESVIARREIPGDKIISDIDFGLALVNHDGDEKLLMQLTKVFCDLYQYSDTELADLLAKDSFEGAERLMHNIAGVAGSFAAFELMQTAKAIEHAIKSQEVVGAEQQAQFSNALGNLVTAIGELHEQTLLRVSPD